MLSIVFIFAFHSTKNLDDRLEFDQAVEKLMRDLRSKPDLLIKDNMIQAKAKKNEY